MRVDADAVLITNGLIRDTVRNSNVFVPAIVVHRFLEDAARAAKDPYLGLHVGERLDLARWPPFVDAVSHATTLGEFLIRFIQAARDDASSAQHSLVVYAIRTVFKEMRTSQQEIAPAQNDAFTAAYTLRLLREGAGRGWEPGMVQLAVCEPGALPDHYLGVTVTRGNRMGIAVRFPTAWLVKALDQRALVKGLLTQKDLLRVPLSFLQALRQTLVLHLQDPNLGVDLVAQVSGMSRQSLQRQLRASGTTLSSEIVKLKKRRAAEYLIDSRKTVADIAQSLGFADPTSFARAFKSWTGESPREYRKSRQTP